MAAQRGNTAIAFVLLFLMMFAGLILSGSCGEILSRYLSGRSLLIADSITQNILAFFLPAWLTFRSLKVNAHVAMGLKTRFPAKAFGVALLILFVSMPAMDMVISFNKSIQLPQSMSEFQNQLVELENRAAEITGEILSASSFGALLVNLLVVACLTGFCEEAFFRSGIQGLLQRSGMNGHACVWITALVFSAMHFQFFGFIPRLLTGAFFGYLFLWSGSLWLNASMHALNNAIVVVVYWLCARGAELNPDEPFVGTGMMFPVLAAVSAAATVAVFVFFGKYLKSRNG